MAEGQLTIFFLHNEGNSDESSVYDRVNCLLFRLRLKYLSTIYTHVILSSVFDAPSPYSQVWQRAQTFITIDLDSMEKEVFYVFF